MHTTFARRCAAALTLALGCGLAAAQTADTNCAATPAQAYTHKQFAKYMAYGETSKIDSITFWLREDICYGDAAIWYDKSAGHNLRERATIYSPVDPTLEPDGTRHPVVIFSHPNGASEKFSYTTGSNVNLYDTSRLFQSVVVQALKAGYVVVSVEFRHPVASFDAAADATPGNTDLRDAVQYLRYNASTWHVDPANMFMVGQSRGSLNMLWALQDDAAATDPQRPWRSASSKVNALWDYQAQTCYDRVPVETNFLLPQSYADMETDKRFAGFPADYAAGCSMNVVANAHALPPMVLMYDEAPKSKTAVTLQPWCKLDWASDAEAYCWTALGWHDKNSYWNTWFDEHDANYGVALVKAFGDAGSPGKIKACYGVTTMYNDASGPWNGYKGFVDFFDKQQNPPVVRTYPTFTCPTVAHSPYTPQ